MEVTVSDVRDGVKDEGKGCTCGHYLWALGSRDQNEPGARNARAHTSRGLRISFYFLFQHHSSQ